jgi:flagellin
MVQNLQASNAQIEDTNMASEMSNFTQDQVLVQAGVSMLAQANQIPDYVLKLLG